MEITKFISNKIEKQFPAIYREDGRELVEFLESYYKFLEENSSNSTFQSRRIFEYRDIDNTLEEMLIFFKNKFLKDLPLDESNIRFIIKHILDLYRRKGSQSGIELFFKMFYNETVRIQYPSSKMFKPSDSKWQIDRYVQLLPEDPTIFSDLESKRIIGSLSRAEAIVNRLVFVVINGSLTPILYLEDIRGEFMGFDEILSGDKKYGRVYGSLENLTVIESDMNVSGRNVGEILNCTSSVGIGGKALVTKISENFSGEISYTVADGGFGFSVENTDLLVSNQTVILENPDLIFNRFETLEDQFGNRGVVIGQNIFSVGVLMESNYEFSANSIIQTIDRDIPVEIEFTNLSGRNDSSPGSNVAIDTLTNSETISLLLDTVEPFLGVSILSTDIETDANTQFSGTANTVTLDTPLSEIFEPQDIVIGTIRNFTNLNPGTDYFNDVFAVARDNLISRLDLKEQNIALSGPTIIFRVGEEITQTRVDLTTLRGIITASNGMTITVRPFSIYGFDPTLPIIYRGNSYTISALSKNYVSPVYGLNAIINTTTEFAVGKVLELRVLNSGYGYVDGSTIQLTDPANPDDVIVLATASARGQGFNEGRWETSSSNIGFDLGTKIQDSFYYQDYSYDILSRLDINTYEKELKQVIHPAGIKMFGTFEYGDVVNVSIDVQDLS